MNESVQKTINSITKLEMILQSKLELFSCEICSAKEDCSCGCSCNYRSIEE